MNRLTFGLVVCVLFFGVFPRGATADLISKYPQTSSYTLKSGVVVGLPIHYFKSRTVMLTGTGDLGPIEEAASQANLFPIVSGEGRALVNLLLIDHQSTTLGPYQEAMIAVPVTTRPKPGLLPSGLQSMISFLSLYLGGPSDTYGIMIWKVSVDTTLAFDAGIEIWGFPKTYSSFDFSDNQMTVREGASLTTLTWVAPPTKSMPLKNIDYYAYTPADIQLTRARTASYAKVSKSRKFGSAGDRFAFGGGEGAITGTLTDIRFAPDMLIENPAQVSVLFAAESR